MSVPHLSSEPPWTISAFGVKTAASYHFNKQLNTKYLP